MNYMDIEFVIDKCKLCDISLNCAFIPSRGMGNERGLIFILPSPTKTDYTNKVYSRANRIIKTLSENYRFPAYYTYLVKCISKGIPSEREILNCRNYFVDELALVKPLVIVTIGDIVTSQFIEYKRFSKVVDKPVKFVLNGKDVVLYPIHNPNVKSDISIKDIYVKSFKNLAKIYSKLNPRFYYNELLD